MKTKQLFLLGMVFIGAGIFAEESPMRDPAVARFLKNGEACEHFAGEWDPDNSRKANLLIEKSVDRYCSVALRQRTSLLKKYKGNAEVLKALDQYESVIYFTPAK